MDREVEDPNQYQDEWFEIAKDLGAEFRLPNISGIPPNISNTSMNLSKSRQPRLVQTNKPRNVEGEGTCHNKVQVFCNISHTTFKSCVRYDADVMVTISLVAESSERTELSVSLTRFKVDQLLDSDQVFRFFCCNHSVVETSVKKNQLVSVSGSVPSDSTVSSNSISISTTKKNSSCRPKSLMDVQSSQVENAEEETHLPIKPNTAESGDHKCLICDAAFASGAALGGHMSSHSRKRKMESLKKNQRLTPSSCSTSGCGDSMSVKGDRSSVVSVEKKAVEENESSQSNTKKRLTICSLEDDRLSSEDAKDQGSE